MRIEVINGRALLCGHILGKEFILPGQRWAPADGSDREVLVVDICPAGWVKYTWDENGVARTHSKESFAFQCRYCLVFDQEDVDDYQPLSTGDADTARLKFIVENNWIATSIRCEHCIQDGNLDSTRWAIDQRKMNEGR